MNIRSYLGKEQKKNKRSVPSNGFVSTWYMPLSEPERHRFAVWLFEGNIFITTQKYEWDRWCERLLEGQLDSEQRCCPFKTPLMDPQNPERKIWIPLMCASKLSQKWNLEIKFIWLLKEAATTKTIPKTDEWKFRIWTWKK